MPECEDTSTNCNGDVKLTEITGIGSTPEFRVTHRYRCAFHRSLLQSHSGFRVVEEGKQA